MITNFKIHKNINNIYLYTLLNIFSGIILSYYIMGNNSKVSKIQNIMNKPQNMTYIFL